MEVSCSMLSTCKFALTIRKMMQPSVSAYMFDVKRLRPRWATTFLARMDRVERSSQKRNRLVSICPIRPWRLDARTVRPKSMPRSTRKKIYKIKFKFISSIALGRK